MKKFWKKISILFLIVFILFVAGLVGGYAFLRNLDITKYKPQIIKMASQALGRPVDFKNIGLKVSWAEGVRLRVSDLSLGENPDFGSEAFVSAGEIDAGLDIFSSITALRIFLSNILIRSLRINIVRNVKGILNVQTFGQPLPGASSQGQGAPAKAVTFPAIFINSFKISNAELHFVDQSVRPEEKISIPQFNLEVRNFSLTNPFDVSLDAVVLSAQTDLRAQGKMQLELSKNKAKLTNVDISADLNQFSLDQLKGLPMLKGVPIPQVLKGQLKTKIMEVVLSDKGLETLVMDVSLNGGQIIAADLAPGISLEAQHLDFSAANFSLNGLAPFQVNLTAALYQEEINVNFKSDVFLDLKTMGIRLASGQFATDLAYWPLEKIKSALAPLKTVPLPEHLAGKLQATIKDLKVSAAGLETVMLDAKLSGGEVALKNVIPDVSVAFNKIDLLVRNFSLTQPFFVSLKTAYLSDDPDISSEGNVSYDLKTQRAKIKDVVFGLDFDKLFLERFKASGLIPKGVPFPQVIGGRVEARINDLSVSSQGVEKMNADIDWQNGKVSILELAPGISVTANSISLRVKNFSFKDAFDVTASLGYESDLPNISFNGKVAFDPATQNVHLSQAVVKTDLSKIPFERLKNTLAPLKAVPLPEVLNGQLEVKVKELSASPRGLTAVMADVAFREGEISMKDIFPGVSFAASHINADIKEFGLNTPFGFNLELAYLHDKPNIQAKGTATVLMEEQSVHLKDTTVETDLSTFAFDQLTSSITALKNASLPEKLQGKFNITIAEAESMQILVENSKVPRIGLS